MGQQIYQEFHKLRRKKRLQQLIKIDVNWKRKFLWD